MVVSHEWGNDLKVCGRDCLRLKSQTTKIPRQNGLQESLFSDHIRPEDTLELNCY